MSSTIAPRPAVAPGDPRLKYAAPVIAVGIAQRTLYRRRTIRPRAARATPPPGLACWWTCTATVRVADAATGRTDAAIAEATAIDRAARICAVISFGAYCPQAGR